MTNITMMVHGAEPVLLGFDTLWVTEVVCLGPPSNRVQRPVGAFARRMRRMPRSNTVVPLGDQRRGDLLCISAPAAQPSPTNDLALWVVVTGQDEDMVSAILYTGDEITLSGVRRHTPSRTMDAFAAMLCDEARRPAPAVLS